MSQLALLEYPTLLIMSPWTSNIHHSSTWLPNNQEVKKWMKSSTPFVGEKVLKREKGNLGKREEEPREERIPVWLLQ